MQLTEDLRTRIEQLPPAKREIMHDALRRIEVTETIMAVLCQQLALTRALTGALREYSSVKQAALAVQQAGASGK